MSILKWKRLNKSRILYVPLADAFEFIRGWPVPRSLVSQKVKILPVLFTFLKSFLKSLRRSLAWSESEPEVGYAGDDPPATWGSSMPL